MTTPLWKRVIVYILEGLLALVFISPLIWVVVCSFSPQPGSAQSKGWGVNNYLTLFGYQEGLPKYLFNSVVVTLVAVVFSVVVCTLAGYSFSRFDYPGRNLGFMVTLSILMVPYASLLIPLMVWYKDIGLNDSLLGVGLVITLFQLPMSTMVPTAAMMPWEFGATTRQKTPHWLQPSIRAASSNSVGKSRKNCRNSWRYFPRSMWMLIRGQHWNEASPDTHLALRQF